MNVLKNVSSRVDIILHLDRISFVMCGCAMWMQMCKRKLGTHIRGKKKREELAGALRRMQAASKQTD
jgi:hypothetical protein